MPKPNLDKELGKKETKEPEETEEEIPEEIGEEPKETKEIEEEPKYHVVQRAVPVEDMFNNIIDRIDIVLAKQMELEKILNELIKLAGGE